MYCKKCGRQLRQGAKFCDHCGSSTKGMTETKKTNSSGRSSGSKSGSSEQYDRNRSRYERNKKRRELERQKARKSRRTALLFILIAILVAVVLGVVTYNMMKPKKKADPNLLENTTSGQSFLNNEEDEPLVDVEGEEAEEEEEPEETEKPTPKPTKEPEKTEEEKEKELEEQFSEIEGEFNIYKHDKLGDIKCPYPKNFEDGSQANANTVYSLMDFENDGTMLICAEKVGKSKSASKMMDDYESGLGDKAKVLSSTSDDNGYEISYERNKRVNYRKAVIVDGICVYYDFSYDYDSQEKSRYDEYIEYINYYLDKEVKSLTEKED